MWYPKQNHGLPITLALYKVPFNFFLLWLHSKWKSLMSLSRQKSATTCWWATELWLTFDKNIVMVKSYGNLKEFHSTCTTLISSNLCTTTWYSDSAKTLHVSQSKLPGCCCSCCIFIFTDKNRIVQEAEHCNWTFRCL